MSETRREHVAQRFARLLDLYRKPDGAEWGGQDLEDTSGGVVTRSYVSNLRGGRIQNPGLAKLEAIAGAMGFPPALWFADDKGFADEALLAQIQDPTTRAILEELPRLGPKDRVMLLAVIRGISLSSSGKSEGS